MPTEFPQHDWIPAHMLLLSIRLQLGCRTIRQTLLCNSHVAHTPMPCSWIHKAHDMELLFQCLIPGCLPGFLAFNQSATKFTLDVFWLLGWVTRGSNKNCFRSPTGDFDDSWGPWWPILSNGLKTAQLPEQKAMTLLALKMHCHSGGHTSPVLQLEMDPGHDNVLDCHVTGHDYALDCSATASSKCNTNHTCAGPF